MNLPTTNPGFDNHCSVLQTVLAPHATHMHDTEQAKGRSDTHGCTCCCCVCNCILDWIGSLLPPLDSLKLLLFWCGVQAGKGFKEGAEAAETAFSKLDKEFEQAATEAKAASEAASENQKLINAGEDEAAKEAAGKPYDQQAIADGQAAAGKKDGLDKAAADAAANEGKLQAQRDAALEAKQALNSANKGFIAWQTAYTAATSGLAGGTGAAANSGYSTPPTFSKFSSVTYADPIQSQNCAEEVATLGTE